MMLCCPCNRMVPLSARHACAWLAVARSADISDDEVLCELLALNGGGRWVLPQSTVGVQSLTHLHATVWADI